MTQILISPAKYIQGSGELNRLGEHCDRLTDGEAFAVIDAFVLANYGEKIAGSFAQSGIPLHVHEFTGEVTMARIEWLAAMPGLRKSGVVLGIGGGKTLDAAKALSHLAGRPVVIVPTVASTDAPCSALSVLYTEDGRLDRYLSLHRSPDMVVVDTAVIAKAPPRLLAAGMGDALSTYYEARACHRSGAVTNAGGTGSLAALALAAACRDTLLADGAAALDAVRQGEVTPAVERIVEANIYLSGVGFESGGLAAAHAIHNGMTVLEECRPMLHGEKVAFATLAQLMLEQAPEEEIGAAVRFCRSVGLPVTLKALGLEDADESKLLRAAEAACEADSPMANMPFTVSPRDVVDALLAADRRGSLAIESGC